MPKEDSLSNKLVLQHEIFILDASLVRALDPTKMKKITHSLVDDLLIQLNMKKLAPLGIYDAADPRAPGWSFIQPITTSHISGHYFIEPDDSNPNIHMDFYSCSSFEWQSIIPIINKHLLLANWHADFLYRKDVMAERTIWEISGDGGNVISKKLLSPNHKVYQG